MNVSAWKDVDKEGRHYSDYFSNASSYSITNYKAEARGFTGEEGEIFLDLEKDLPVGLIQRFDVVSNETSTPTGASGVLAIGPMAKAMC